MHDWEAARAVSDTEGTEIQRRVTKCHVMISFAADTDADTDPDYRSTARAACRINQSGT